MEDLQPGIPETPYDWSWTIVVGLFLLAGAITLFIIYQKRGYIIKGFRQTWQRLLTPMPTYFRNIFWACIAFFAAPGLLDIITEVINEPEMHPSWLHSDWLKMLRYMCLAAAGIAKLPIPYDRVTPKQIPDIKHPAKPDAIIDVAPNGTMKVEVLNQPEA